MPDLETGAEVQFGWTLGRGGFSFGWFPREGASVGVDVQDAQSRLAPAGAAVFDHGYATPEAGHKTADYKIGGVGAARGGLEGG